MKEPGTGFIVTEEPAAWDEGVAYTPLAASAADELAARAEEEPEARDAETERILSEAEASVSELGALPKMLPRRARIG